MSLREDAARKMASNMCSHASQPDRYCGACAFSGARALDGLVAYLREHAVEWEQEVESLIAATQAYGMVVWRLLAVLEGEQE